jgi:hypothetical protein
MKFMIGFLSGAMALCFPALGRGDEAATARPEAKTAMADWPRYRGARGNGISLENDWQATALVPAPKIQWRVQVGQGYSSVCIAGPCLYTMGSLVVSMDQPVKPALGRPCGVAGSGVCFLGL